MRKHWLLTLLPLVCAGGTGPRNWGVPKILRQSASASERQACGEAGSFFVEVAGKTLCSSSKTREAPQSADCPIGWSTHKTTGSCLPPSEVSEADCGEGYNWIGNGKSCAPFTGQGQKGCREGQWYHSRSMSCIDNSWSTRPPSGQCDNGKSCPEGWFWHAQLRQCRPEKKRSPKPNCKDWNDKEQCCGGHHPPKPSAGVGHGGGGGSGGGHGGHKGQGDRGKNKGGNGGFGHGSSGHKRDSPIKRDQDPLGTTFKQSDLDKLYCPKNLHACSITTTGGEWAYECIDFATELESCGGRGSMGEGQDCTAIPYAKSVGCEAGLCAVYSCKAGLRSNGTACV